MEQEYIDLFVPGRLCIMGEHSDWAGRYRKENNNIEKGYAIVTGIEEGIYAKVSKSDKFKVRNEVNGNNFISNMDYNELLKIALDGGYFSYVAGVASCMMKKYPVGGIEIVVNKTTLPEKKRTNFISSYMCFNS